MALRVATVGISYEGSGVLQHLPGARTDAFRVYTALERHRPDGEPFFLAVEREQTTSSVLRAGLARFFGGTKPGDDVVFIFEGHGIRKNERSYLASYNYDPNDRATALGVSDVADMMRIGRPANRILIVDACHSGQRRLAGAGIGPDIFALGDGLSILSACDLGESAIEVVELGGGLFSSVICEGLEGAAGYVVRDSRVVTVSRLFGFVARRVPAWIAANRHRWPSSVGVRMTPRCVADLTGDPVLAVVPLVRGSVGDRHRLTERAAVFSSPRSWEDTLESLAAIAEVAVAKAERDYWPGAFQIDLPTHLDEMDRLIGRCLGDLGGKFNVAEVFVLRSAVQLHDVGLLEALPLSERLRVAAEYVRKGAARGMGIPMPDPILREAVALTLEAPDVFPIRGRVLYWGGSPIQTGQLGIIFRIGHCLSVMGERRTIDVGDGEVGQCWIRRRLLTSVADWVEDGVARARTVPDRTRHDREAIDRWEATVSGDLRALSCVGRIAVGPRSLMVTRDD